jgi:hypothetical protein
LLSSAGAVVRKEDLLETVWPGVLVVDASLTTAVSKLRRALGDHDLIQTVSKVGYRICVPVEMDLTLGANVAPSEAVNPLPAASPLASQAQPRPRSALRLWGAAILIAASGAFIALQFRALNVGVAAAGRLRVLVAVATGLIKK